MDPYHLQQALQAELLPGESLMWSGEPSTSVIFHKGDVLSIPGSLLWGGFAILWTIGASGHWDGKGSPAFALFGVPFILIGQYIIWGRFVHAAWKKRRILYGLTDKRVLIINISWRQKTTAVYLDRVPMIEKSIRSDGIGTLHFGQLLPNFGWSKGFGSFDPLDTSGVPAFVDIEDAQSVYAMAATLREKLGDQKA